ncbi:hypothetical protein GCM10011487_43430 [Steroidobacter agaridevorans]|uniref:Immunity MXAN-0049 protein domain-containing protein n=1 Tax=Steroidobacter agaridevorans TaxID=2695856 RepID=A0A829YHH2_9GAMM|nr:DUF1629 domain-containing protein [Steroidobacter agaridevorans]GFE82343.1 hypothetical protein GCM10011487_43430 [Steroidobacter agaridevorans]
MPSNPAKAGESRFVVIRTDFDYVQPSNVVWVNQPNPPGWLGHGAGFASLRDGRPRFTEDQPRPAQVSGGWNYASWMIVSPRFAATIRRFDPDVIETVEIDWEFADGQKLEGYAFLDVTRLLHAYDYRRSVAHVKIHESGQKFIHLGAPTALKADLPANVHVFREAYFRGDVFCSRELARALLEAEPHGFYFEDPASGLVSLSELGPS